MRSTCIVLAMNLCLASQATTAADIPSHYAENFITIDGKADDWPSLAGMILKDHNAAISVANDEKYLYCTFRTTDIKWVRAIRMAGMTLYLDVDGGKHKDFYLKFTGGPPPDRRRPEQAEQPGSQLPGDFRGMQGAPENSAPQLMLYIKDRIAEKEIPVDGAQGPAAAFDTSLGFFTYEFRVPLEYGEPLNFGLGVKKDKKIGVGLVWGDMQGMYKGNLPKGGFGDRPGGDGGFPGGGMEPRSGGGGHPKGMRREMPSKQEVWLKTKLTNAEN